MIFELLIIGAVIAFAQLSRFWSVLFLLVVGILLESVSSLPVGMTIGALALAYASVAMLKRRLLFEQPLAILLLELTGIVVFVVAKTALVMLALHGALASTMILRGIMTAALYMLTLVVFSVTFMASYYFYHAVVTKTPKARLR